MIFTLKQVAAGYAGVKLTKGGWVHTFREDIRILRQAGHHQEARMVELFARDWCTRVIASGT